MPDPNEKEKASPRQKTGYWSGDAPGFDPATGEPIPVHYLDPRTGQPVMTTLPEMQAMQHAAEVAREGQAGKLVPRAKTREDIIYPPTRVAAVAPVAGMPQTMQAPPAAAPPDPGVVQAALAKLHALSPDAAIALGYQPQMMGMGQMPVARRY